MKITERILRLFKRKRKDRESKKPEDSPELSCRRGLSIETGDSELCNIRLKVARETAEVLIQSIIREAFSQIAQLEKTKQDLSRRNGLQQQLITPPTCTSIRPRASFRLPSSVVPLFDERGNLIKEDCSEQPKNNHPSIQELSNNHVDNECMTTADNDTSLCRLVRNRPNERSSVKLKRDFFDRIALNSSTSESKATPKTFDDFISDQNEISNPSICDDSSSSSLSGVLQQQSECQEDEFRPLFLKGLRDLTINEGDKLCLECIVDGFPFPEIVWLHDDKEIENSSDGIQISHSTEDGVCRAGIDEITVKVAGKYVCMATNNMGSISTSCHLRVLSTLETN
ncbi:uncharacterized protein LOC141852792 [Brevipalpus obovatus]|uniref:uncharacterized protein LOC141852792 n=1 Tax=Brevipalpus obovatus TaxID=246614 RepID=UPI003D9F1E36